MPLKNWLIEKIAIKEGKKMLDKLEGKKTYIVLGVTALLGALDAYNGHCLATAACKAFDVPPIVYTILAGLGVYTRAIAKPKA